MTRPVVHEAAERVYRLLPDYMRAGDDALTGEYVDYFARRTNLVANPSFGVDVTGWSATSETSDDLEAELLLRQAVLWLDAKYATSSQTVPNLGTGGTALDATLGSTGTADSNDPKFLAYDGTPLVYLPGVSGNYLSTPDAAALDITGDIDIRVKVAMDDWTPSGDQEFVAKWVTSTADRSYIFRLNAAGTLQIVWSADGATFISSSSTVATGVTDGAAKWVRATLDVDNGAGGNDVKFYLSDDGTSWTQLGATVTTASTTSIFSGSAPLEIGAAFSGTARLAAGKFYRAIVKSGIDGTTVLDIDTSVLTTGAATSFTATTGQTVTINRSTSGRKAVAVTAPCWLLGTDDYMEVADNALLDFDADDSFTVLAVVRQWATPTASGRYVDKWDYATGGAAGWTLQSDGTAARALAYVDDGPDAAQQSSGNFTLGSLVTLSMRLDRSLNTIVPGYNSTFATGSSTTAIGDISNSYPLRIGRNAGTGTGYQGFELVAVAVFRSALTSDQIAQLNTYFQARAALATAAPSRSTTSPQSGTHVGQFANTAGYPTRGAVYASAAVVAGTAYTGSLHARGGSASARAVIDWYAGSTYLGRSAGTAAALSSSLQRYSATGTAPVGATHARLRLDSAANTATLDVDAALIETSPDLLDYFDGDTSGATWTGTTGSSVSILRYPVAGTGSPMWLLRYVAAAATGLEKVTDFLTIVDPDTSPSGTSEPVNPAVAPRAWLPWLGWLIGIDTSAIPEASVRSVLQDATSNRLRGSREAIKAAVARTLSTPVPAARVYANLGGADPYLISVVTTTSQTPDPAATLEAATAEKPAGMLLELQVLTGAVIVELEYAFPNIPLLEAEFATVADVSAWFPPS